MNHVDHLIDLLLDDRLDEKQALQVREHCRVCASCGEQLRQAEDLLDALFVATAPALGRSIWPEVQRQVASSAVSSAAPRGRLGFAFSGMAAVAAGLFLGLWLTGLPAEDGRVPSIMDQGVVLAGDSSETLDQLFLAAGRSEGETP